MMMSLGKRFQQLRSMLKHGGLPRALEILWERHRLGYSKRSLTYSWPKPIQIHFDQEEKPSTWFFLPHLLPDYSFAGLQTLLELAKEQLKKGQRLHLVLTDFGGDLDTFFSAIGAQPFEKKLWATRVRLVNESMSSQMVLRGHLLDQFYVASWWTFKGLYAHLAESLFERLTYIVQDDESLFYDGHDPVEAKLKMLAKSSYVPGVRYLINSTSLADHLSLHYGINQHNCVSWEVFEPRINQTLFYRSNQKKKKQIFVYARPQVGRNCFDLCLKALELASEELPKDWELIGAGTLETDFRLDSGRILRACRKLPVEAYANLLRDTPVGLSLMASPHPSHPPLELAACGGYVVTNRYSTKDLSKSCERVFSPDLSAEAVASSLVQAVKLAKQTWGYL